MSERRVGPGRAELLGALVRRLPEWQLAAFRFNDALAHRLGIVTSDLHCLFVLDGQGPLSPGAIAERVGLTTGSASRLVDRLVAAGLVSREPDPADRRRVIVAIRPAASARLHAVYDPLDDELRAHLEELDDRALDQLRTFVAEAIDLTRRRTDALARED